MVRIRGIADSTPFGRTPCPPLAAVRFREEAGRNGGAENGRNGRVRVAPFSRLVEDSDTGESWPSGAAKQGARSLRALDADLRFADRWEYRGVMPMYLWIIDGEKAVFAIPSLGDQLTEYGFYTEEAGLVQALLSVWARYLETAHRVSAQPILVKATSGRG